MFRTSIIFFCGGIALRAFARNYWLYSYNSEISICGKNVILAHWKEFLTLWNSSGIRVEREQKEVNKEVSRVDGIFP